MKRDCDCYESVQASVAEERREAKATEHGYSERLFAFRGGIIDGAKELAARHLFKAGVYLACLDNSFSRDPALDEVVRCLAERLEEGVEPELREFFARNADLIRSQLAGVEPSELLKGILRRKEGTKGLLEANASNEFEQAKTALEKAGELSNQLESWKEGIRLESRVSVVEIIDMHGSS